MGFISARTDSAGDGREVCLLMKLCRKAAIGLETAMQEEEVENCKGSCDKLRATLHQA